MTMLDGPNAESSWGASRSHWWPPRGASAGSWGRAWVRTAGGLPGLQPVHLGSVAAGRWRVACSAGLYRAGTGSGPVVPWGLTCSASRARQSWSWSEWPWRPGSFGWSRSGWPGGAATRPEPRPRPVSVSARPTTRLAPCAPGWTGCVSSPRRIGSTLRLRRCRMPPRSLSA